MKEQQLRLVQMKADGTAGCMFDGTNRCSGNCRDCEVGRTILLKLCLVEQLIDERGKA